MKLRRKAGKARRLTTQSSMFNETEIYYHPESSETLYSTPNGLVAYTWDLWKFKWAPENEKFFSLNFVEKAKQALSEKEVMA